MAKPRFHLPYFLLLTIASWMFTSSTVSAVECASCDSVNDCCCSEACSSDVWTCSQLTGDWLGCRTAIADCGIVLDADVTQFYQGVASGGLEQVFRYAGHGDYVLKFDFDKLSGQEGLFLQLGAEHRFGGSLPSADTAILCGLRGNLVF